MRDYERKKRRASPKRLHAAKKKREKRAKTKAKTKATVSSKAVRGKRVAAAKKVSARASSSRTRTRGATKKRSRATQRTSSKKTAAGKRSSSKAAKATAKKKPIAKPAPKKSTPAKAAPKKAAAKTKKPKRLTKAELQKRVRRLQGKLDQLEQKRQKARRKTARKPKRQAKKEFRQGKARLEKSRKKELLVAEEAPRKTPKQRSSSLLAIRDRQQRNFRRLLGLAKQLNQLPKSPNWNKRRFKNDKAHGEQRFISVNRILDEGVVESIMYEVRHRIQNMSERYALWLGVMVFSTLGERLVGYGQRILNANDPDAPDFSAEVIDSTGANDTKERMLYNLEFKIEDLAGEQATVVYLHHIKIMNFTRQRTS